MMTVLTFIAGFFVGELIGVIIMALAAAASRVDNHNEI